MPTIAEALPNLQSMFEEMTSPPLSRERTDELIATITHAVAAPAGAALEAIADPMFQLAEAGETRAFEPICRCLSAIQPGAYDIEFGNIVTELLPSILVSVFDGEAERLADVILSSRTDEYIRSSALCALVQLTRDGVVDRSVAERVLVALPRTAPDPTSVLWHTWPIAIAALRLWEFEPLVERLLSAPDIVEAAESLAAFRDEMTLHAANPDAAGSFEFTPFTTAAWARARTKQLDDMFEQLTKLMTDARDKRPADRAGQTVRRAMDWQEYGSAITEPVTNDYRNVGRNDPCPCGSGKKHKKCCLN